jgi:hypothetical protein
LVASFHTAIIGKNTIITAIIGKNTNHQQEHKSSARTPVITRKNTKNRCQAAKPCAIIIGKNIATPKSWQEQRNHINHGKNSAITIT